MHNYQNWSCWLWSVKAEESSSNKLDHLCIVIYLGSDDWQYVGVWAWFNIFNCKDAQKEMWFTVKSKQGEIFSKNTTK